jgi:hypothetical protein
MSTAGYVATPTVRHLAAWTADDSRRGIGNYRNLCGHPRLDQDVLIWASEVGPNPSIVNPDPVWQKHLAAAMRRPVCKDCAATVSDLIWLRGGAS